MARLLGYCTILGVMRAIFNNCAIRPVEFWLLSTSFFHLHSLPLPLTTNLRCSEQGMSSLEEAYHSERGLEKRRGLLDATSN
jgi:hypothetical protein